MNLNGLTTAQLERELIHRAIARTNQDIRELTLQLMNMYAWQSARYAELDRQEQSISTTKNAENT